jgi:hypothetical protein
MYEAIDVVNSSTTLFRKLFWPPKPGIHADCPTGVRVQRDLARVDPSRLAYPTSKLHTITSDLLVER